MAALANVVLNDAQATPVAHTFAPAKSEADFALFEDRASGIYVGYNKLTIRMLRPTGPSQGGNRNLRVSIKVETPKLEALGNSAAGITPPPTVAHRPVAETTFTLPERCSLQDRKDLLTFQIGALQSVIGANAVWNYEMPW